jgi:hypothetical protein
MTVSNVFCHFLYLKRRFISSFYFSHFTNLNVEFFFLILSLYYQTKEGTLSRFERFTLKVIKAMHTLIRIESDTK